MATAGDGAVVEDLAGRADRAQAYYATAAA